MFASVVSIEELRDQCQVESSQKVTKIISKTLWLIRREEEGLRGGSICLCLKVNVQTGYLKLLRSPGIDSKESILPAYIAWRDGTTKYRVIVQVRHAGYIDWRSRFLGTDS